MEIQRSDDNRYICKCICENFETSDVLIGTTHLIIKTYKYTYLNYSRNSFSFSIIQLSR